MIEKDVRIKAVATMWCRQLKNVGCSRKAGIFRLPGEWDKENIVTQCAQS